MSHIRVAMIGTHEDLDWIYENTTSDSSSETRAEQAFGYDYLSEGQMPYIPTTDELTKFAEQTNDKPAFCEKVYIWWKDSDDWDNLPLFTKKDTLAWRQLLNLNFTDILDLRPREKWYNFNWNGKRNKTPNELLSDIINLPDDITFFFGSAHL